MKRIEYLNLELSIYHSKKTTLDRYYIFCNIEGNFKHDLHKKKSLLNSLVYLIVNSSRNLKLKFDKLN